MVASGVTRSRLPADNEVVCTLSNPGVPELARELGTTRSAAALELLARPARGLGRGRRQRADRALPAAGDDRGGRGSPGRGHRRAGRVRRRRRVQGRAGRAIRPSSSTSSSTAAGAAARSPPPPSTRWRASANERAALRRRASARATRSCVTVKARRVIEAARRDRLPDRARGQRRGAADRGSVHRRRPDRAGARLSRDHG